MDSDFDALLWLRSKQGQYDGYPDGSQDRIRHDYFKACADELESLRGATANLADLQERSDEYVVASQRADAYLKRQLAACTAILDRFVNFSKEMPSDIQTCLDMGNRIAADAEQFLKAQSRRSSGL